VKFDKVVGYVSTPETDKVVAECQEKLSSAFTELSLRYDNRQYGSKLGGDVFFLSIIIPHKHICDLSSFQLKDLEAKQKSLFDKAKIAVAKGKDDPDLLIEISVVANAIDRCEKIGIFTAATNGSTFFWAPEFINKLSKVGLRLLICHEGVHTYFSHSARKGNRNHKLFNIALDFKVNNFLMKDLIARGIKEPSKLFKEHLGDFINLAEYTAILRNPFAPPERLDHISPIHSMRKALDDAYVDPGEKKQGMYYAEEKIPVELTIPEKIYDHLHSVIPKCDVCGLLGVYEKPAEYKEIETKLHGEWVACGHEDCCTKCGCRFCKNSGEFHVYLNPFQDDNTLDQHMDMDVSDDDMLKRIQQASDLAKQFGQDATGFDGLLKSLERPTLTYQDFIRIIRAKNKAGSRKRNWMVPKRKALFAGMYVPTSHTNTFTVLVGYDCSASMSKPLLTKGISQILALKNHETVIYLVPWAHTTYWSEMAKVSGASVDQLLKAKIRIDGGTECSSFFNEYRKEVGDVDLIVCITDSYLANHELANVKTPPGNTQTVWLQVAKNNFKPKFGRVFELWE
jgi:predicted metal-dependent peptidase